MICCLIGVCEKRKFVVFLQRHMRENEQDDTHTYDISNLYYEITRATRCIFCRNILSIEILELNPMMMIITSWLDVNKLYREIARQPKLSQDAMANVHILRDIFDTCWIIWKRREYVLFILIVINSILLINLREKKDQLLF